MSRAVAIGSETRLAGYRLAGVEVIAVDGSEGVVDAIEQITDDVALVILTEEPGADARTALQRRRGTVWCSLPN